MHTPSAHLPCPLQSPSHVSLISHASPAQSGWHSQKLSSRHSPCCSHPAGHSVRRWHASPSKPGSHTHVPFAALHRPLPEQPAGHAAGASHAVPLHPDDTRTAAARAHDPRPSAHEQLFGRRRPVDAAPRAGRPPGRAAAVLAAPRRARARRGRIARAAARSRSRREYPAGQRQPSAAQTPRPSSWRRTASRCGRGATRRAARRRRPRTLDRSGRPDPARLLQSTPPQPWSQKHRPRTQTPRPRQPDGRWRRARRRPAYPARQALPNCTRRASSRRTRFGTPPRRAAPTRLARAQPVGEARAAVRAVGGAERRRRAIGPAPPRLARARVAGGRRGPGRARWRRSAHASPPAAPPRTRSAPTRRSGRGAARRRARAGHRLRAVGARPHGSHSHTEMALAVAEQPPSHPSIVEQSAPPHPGCGSTRRASAPRPGTLAVGAAHTGSAASSWRRSDMYVHEPAAAVAGRSASHAFDAEQSPPRHRVRTQAPTRRAVARAVRRARHRMNSPRPSSPHAEAAVAEALAVRRPAAPAGAVGAARWR